MGNMIMIFLSVFVVHRAVTETRDIHVEEKHAHPDPRLVEKAWGDHRLDVWSWSLALWALMVNIMSWSGAHAISQRPPLRVVSSGCQCCTYSLACFPSSY